MKDSTVSAHWRLYRIVIDWGIRWWYGWVEVVMPRKERASWTVVRLGAGNWRLERHLVFEFFVAAKSEKERSNESHHCYGSNDQATYGSSRETSTTAVGRCRRTGTRRAASQD